MRHDDPSKVPEPKLLLGGTLVIFYDRDRDGRLRARALIESDELLSDSWDVLLTLIRAMAKHDRVR